MLPGTSLCRLKLGTTSIRYGSSPRGSESKRRCSSIVKDVSSSRPRQFALGDVGKVVGRVKSDDPAAVADLDVRCITSGPEGEHANYHQVGVLHFAHEFERRIPGSGPSSRGPCGSR